MVTHNSSVMQETAAMESAAMESAAMESAAMESAAMETAATELVSASPRGVGAGGGTSLLPESGSLITGPGLPGLDIAPGDQRVRPADDRLEQWVVSCQQGVGQQGVGQQGVGKAAETDRRDRLVERLRPIIRGMARTMALRLPRCVDAEDLEHAGLWGLMQAIERFDPRHGVAFLTFMRIRVRGAMLDELRALDVLPRPTRQRLRKREDVLARLRVELAREPSHDELAHALGTTPQVLDRDQQLAAPWVGAGKEAGQGDPVDAVPDEAAESPLEALNRQELLAKIQHILSPLEWDVVRLLYLEGRTGKDVAAEMELSAARICQIHQRVLERLKQRLGNG